MVTCPFCGREVNPTQAKELEELMDVEWAVPLRQRCFLNIRWTNSGDLYLR